MPFGSFFGAIVFGVLGVMLGSRMFGAEVGIVKLMGASLIVLGITLAVGLLMKRSWARWIGVAAGFWLAWIAGATFLDQGGVFYLTVVLAAVAAVVLLALPATGRPRRDPSLGPQKPSIVSRALLGTACLALVGLVGAAALAVVRQPVSQEAAAGAEESKATTARAASPGGHGGEASAGATAPVGSVTWSNFADGLKLAKRDRKLIVADFYATWCGPCKMLDKRTFHDPRVMARLKDVVPVKVDAEETVDRGGMRGVDLADRYSIESYPTIVVVDGNGHEIARSTGVLDPESFLAWVDSVIEKAGTAVARS